MARWLGLAALGRGAATTTCLASAGSFLVMVTCILALAAVVMASCAAHLLFHRRNDQTRRTASTRRSSAADSPAYCFASFKRKIPGRAFISSSSGEKVWRSTKVGRREDDDGDDKMNAYDCAAMEEEDGGFLLWQRSILMGERCQLPDFSGLIIYDDKGNLLAQFPPRSPTFNVFHPSLHQGNGVEQR